MKDNKKEFDIYAQGKSIFFLHNIFKISEPTVKKWKAINGTVPDYAIEIISLKQQIKELIELVNSSDDELENIKGDIRNFFNYQKKLKKY